MTCLRVTLRSVPGPMAQYTARAIVHVNSDATAADIKAAAVRKLQRGDYPDRGASCWRVIDTKVMP